MKKFKYKLEGLRKLREFKEHESKIHLGIINREIAQVEQKIKKLHLDIDQGYNSQNKMAEIGTDGKCLQFYPYFNEGKREHIKALENELFSLKNEHQEKLEELYKRRGESKIINNLKEKEKSEYRTKISRKIEREIQDLNIISQRPKGESK